MNPMVKELTQDTDSLLMEIGFTGAMYGAGAVCSAIYDYLRESSKYANGAALAEALSLVSMKQYELAAAYLEKLLTVNLSDEQSSAAKCFLALSYAMSGQSAKVKELELSNADDKQVFGMIQALNGF